MTHINRLANLFGPAAVCKACNEQPRPDDADRFAELKQLVGELLKKCRESNLPDDQLAHIISLAIYKSATGGRPDGR